MLIIITVLLYFAALMLFSRVTARRGDNNQTFFRANRRSPWYMVAFGMVGASISGITFVSVPGMTMFTGMTYVQMCIGFILGYFAVAFVLLPVYYRLNLTTIYTYLKERLGIRSYKTGAWFFLISKMTGAAVRFYVVCIILQRFVLDAIGVPFALTVVAMVALIWLYTRRGGIKTLVWTDTFQTTCMFAALILIIYNVMGQLGMSATDAVKAIAADEHSRMFVMDDWISTQNFWKQLLSGAFVVIVMTGLDQDMILLKCRLGIDSPYHKLLRGHSPTRGRRATAPPCTYWHCRGVRSVYPDVQDAQLYKRYRCHIHPVLLYIRSVVGIVCLRSVYQPKAVRQTCALHSCGVAACVLCA